MDAYWQQVLAYNASHVVYYYAANVEQHALLHKKWMESVTHNEWFLFAGRLFNQSRPQLGGGGRRWRDSSQLLLDDSGGLITFSRFLGFHAIEDVLLQRRNFWERLVSH